MSPSAYLKVVLITCFALSLSTAQTWQYLGLRNFYITALTIDPKNPDVIYAGSIGDFSSGLPGGLFKTTNAGATWDTLLRWVSPTHIVIHPDSSNILWVALGTANLSASGILKSTNGGLSWSRADSGIHIDGETSVFSIVINPRNPNVMYAGTSGFFGGTLFKSTNGSHTWFHPGDVDDQGVVRIILDPVHPDTLYAGQANVSRSFNGGASWDTVSWNVGPHDLVLDDIEPQRLYCLIEFSHGGPFARTTDRGESWIRNRIVGNTRHEGYSIVINRKNRNELFVAIGAIDQRLRGVYKSTNRGDSWVNMNEGIERLIPYRLAIDSMTGRLYLGITNDTLGGVYVCDLVTDVKNDGDMRGYLLQQNYPNPFNGVSIITYSLPHRDRVQLVVYDLLGREISTLVNGFQEAGEHKTVFDGSHIASGVYFYRLQAGEFTQAKKLILLR